MKAKEFLLNYLEKETDFYNSEKVDGYGVMKVDNFVSVIEQYANKRVIKELERLIANWENIGLDIADLHKRKRELEELKRG